MNAIDIWLVLALLALIGAAALLGAAEAALLRVSRVRIEVDAADGRRRAALLLGLIDDLPRVLNTVLLVVLLVQIAAAAIAGILADRRFGSLGVTVASIVLTIILFVYSEAIPKTFAVAHPVRVGYTTAPLLATLTFILRPVVAVLMWFANLQAPGTGVVSPAAPTSEELLMLASLAAATGTIDETDRLLIDRVFELGDRNVDEIYVPRLDIVAVRSDASVREALDVAVSSGHRRMPIYEGDIDRITGTVGMRDLAAGVLHEADRRVAEIADPPLIVPESRSVVELLGDMQSAQVHLAVVVDEFGGTAGIVTIEDVVTRLVGRISDGSEVPVGGIEQIDAATWLIVGSTDVDDFERAVDVELPEGDWNTMAGLMIAHLDHLPSVGESVTIDNVRLDVTATQAHRITTLRATLL